MNNNQLNEKAIRDVFSVPSYVTVGSKDAPVEYNIKLHSRSAHAGKQFLTTGPKTGNTPDAFLEKKHNWIADGAPYVDQLSYQSEQKEKKKGFYSGDFKRRDEFSNTFRTEQYREQLKKEHKHSKTALNELQTDLATRRTFSGMTERIKGKFEGPEHLYDIGRRGASTEHCSKCHRETFYCVHKASYGNQNPGETKRFGTVRVSSQEVGMTANENEYSTPQYARRSVTRDEFFRRSSRGTLMGSGYASQ